MINEKEKIYVVGDCGPEHNTIRSIHKTYEGALKEWDKIRTELLNEAKMLLKDEKHDKGIWEEEVKRLSCKDPKKIDNYPHETPYIHEYVVEE